MESQDIFAEELSLRQRFDGLLATASLSLLAFLLLIAAVDFGIVFYRWSDMNMVVSQFAALQASRGPGQTDLEQSGDQLRTEIAKVLGLGPEERQEMEIKMSYSNEPPTLQVSANAPISCLLCTLLPKHEVSLEIRTEVPVPTDRADLHDQPSENKVEQPR